MSDYDDLVAALSPVSAALTKLGIRHYVAGSVASSLHGASRSTKDVDIVADMTDPLEIHVATAEDAVISKLEWYRKTNETSERQWDDVTRLLKLLGETADAVYLKKSAESVGVEDLLERLMSDT